MAAVVMTALMPLMAAAQIGEYRNDLSVGVGGGYVLSSVNFTPRVPQGLHGGPTGGVAIRYVCGEYYSMIWSVPAEGKFFLY